MVQIAKPSLSFSYFQSGGCVVETCFSPQLELVMLPAGCWFFRGSTVMEQAGGAL